jgi:flagellar basal-body rod protein FlgC
MYAQHRRIETIAHNIANVETTRTAEGGPYRRREVVLRERFFPPPDELAAGEVYGSGIVPGELVTPLSEAKTAGGVTLEGIEEDPTEGRLVYDPSHPDADVAGYVRLPNVRITDELVDLMGARRVYEANATVFEAVKGMLRRSLEI